MKAKNLPDPGAGIPGVDYPEIDQSKCTKCGICLKVCAPVMYEMHGGQVTLVRPEWCFHCGHCGAACPAGAIREAFSEPVPAGAPEIVSPAFSDGLQLLFRSRRSVRKYKKKPVSREDIEKILEAGRYTATGTNAQTLRYMVITDPEKIDELRRIAFPAVLKMFAFVGKLTKLPFASRLMGEELRDRMKNRYVEGMKLFEEQMRRGEDKLFHDAPAIILVFAEKFDETQAFSAAAALYNCSLMAHTLGIGCCFNGFLWMAINFNRKLRKWFGLPRNLKCYGAMTLGYQEVKYHRLVRRNPVKVEWR